MTILVNLQIHLIYRTPYLTVTVPDISVFIFTKPPSDKTERGFVWGLVGEELELVGAFGGGRRAKNPFFY